MAKEYSGVILGTEKEVEPTFSEVVKNINGIKGYCKWDRKTNKWLLQNNFKGEWVVIWEKKQTGDSHLGVLEYNPVPGTAKAFWMGNVPPLTPPVSPIPLPLLPEEKLTYFKLTPIVNDKSSLFSFFKTTANTFQWDEYKPQSGGRRKSRRKISRKKKHRRSQKARI